MGHNRSAAGFNKAAMLIHQNGFQGTRAKVNSKRIHGISLSFNPV